MMRAPLSYLEKQLKELYGPMYLFASHGQELLGLAEKHGKLAEEHLEVGQGGFHDDRLMKEFDKDIDIRNKYVSNIRQDGNSMREILSTSYHLVDSDDFDLVKRFLLDYKRLDVEFEESGKLKTPRKIYAEIEPPYILDFELVKQVEKKFLQKQKRLTELSADKSKHNLNVRDFWRNFSSWVKR